MIRPLELYLIKNSELFRFKNMQKEWEEAEVAYKRLEEILKKHNEIDES